MRTPLKYLGIVVVAGASLGGTCSFFGSDEDVSLPVAAVQVNPGSALLLPGRTEQFRAFAVDRLGQSVTAEFAWKATGGEVTPDGIYAAGVIPGEYVVLARELKTNLADTALVTIQALP